LKKKKKCRELVKEVLKASCEISQQFSYIVSQVSSSKYTSAHFNLLPNPWSANSSAATAQQVQNQHSHSCKTLQSKFQILHRKSCNLFILLRQNKRIYPLIQPH